MAQKELQTLIARNRLLSWEQKEVLLEKVDELTEEQVAQLIQHFHASNEQVKKLLIAQMKEADVRDAQFQTVFKEAKKKIIRKTGDEVSEDDAENAEAYLANELEKMEPKEERKGFLRRIWDTIKNFFKK